MIATTSPDAGSGEVIRIRKGYSVIFSDYAARTVYGTSGDDVLNEGGWVLGGQGNDAITGNAFSDTLIGGNGIGNVDAVTDFDFGEDRIQLDSGIFAGLRSGPLEAAAFTLDKNATTADHRIIYHAETGELFYDADGTGRIEQVKFAVLVPGAVLSADLFMIA